MLEVKSESKQKPDWAKWFHLSSKNLGDTFEFVPRIPRSPFEDNEGVVIEDTITDRTSWAPSVEKAMEAITSDGVFHIYAVENLPGDVDLKKEIPKCTKRVGSDKMPYGYDYSFSDFVSKKYPNWPAEFDLTDKQELQLKRDFKKKLKKCVPDAEKTKEHWATKPVVAKRVGTYNPYKNTVKWD